MQARGTALVYRPGSLGDTLVSLPAIAEVRRRHPEHRLVLLTEQIPHGSRRVSPWAILESTGWFDAAHFYVVKPASARDHWHNVRVASRLRAEGFDDIYSLAPPRTQSQLSRDARLFGTIVGAKRYHAATRPSWPPKPETAPVEHEALRLLRIVDPAADDRGDACRLDVPARDNEAGAVVLRELGVGGDDLLVGIGPGSARQATTWPIERFTAVGEALLRRFRRLTLLAIGDDSERRLCEQLCSAWGTRSRNLAGTLSVLGSAAVLSRCATFIGNDSGPTHLAAMVGIPCVAIFSARNAAAAQWAPLGRHHVVLERRPACAGCMLDECIGEAKKCLTGIAISEVVTEAASIIELDARCGSA